MKRGQNNGNARRENAALLSRKCHKSTREGGTAGRCRGGPGVAGTGGERRTRGCNVLMLAAPWWAGGRGRQVFFLSFLFFSSLLFIPIYLFIPYFICSLYFISFLLFLSFISRRLIFLLFLRIFDFDSLSLNPPPLFPLPKLIKIDLEQPTPS